MGLHEFPELDSTLQEGFQRVIETHQRGEVASFAHGSYSPDARDQLRPTGFEDVTRAVVIELEALYTAATRLGRPLTDRERALVASKVLDAGKRLEALGTQIAP